MPNVPYLDTQHMKNGMLGTYDQFGMSSITPGAAVVNCSCWIVVRTVQAWTSQLNDPPMVTEDGIDTSEWPQNNLIVAISSDRGLCGGEKVCTHVSYSLSLRLLLEQRLLH